MYKIYPINELGKQTVSKLFENKDRIDFTPYYQRFGGLWSNSKKRLLIDTIINGFDIPKFYFNYFIETNNPININDKLYAIIDGKQRIQTIFEFLENRFTLDKTCKIYEKNVSLDGYNFDKISSEFPTVAKQIKNYVLDVVFIVTDEDDRMEEMFLRLNGGMALTNAEKRNAINSYVNREIRRIITSHTFFTKKIRFKNPRFQHNDLLTKLLFLEYSNKLVNLGNNELEKFIRAFSEENINSIRIVDDCVIILDYLSSVFENNDMLLKGKGIIPVYYQFAKLNKTKDSNEIYNFFKEFESIRIDNRQREEPGSTLQEFDLYNQQGVHRETSLSYRYKVLSAFFDYYNQNGNLINSVETIKIEDELDFENFDEY